MNDRHRFWRTIYVAFASLCVIAFCPAASLAAGLTLSIHDVGSGADPLVDSWTSPQTLLRARFASPSTAA